MGQRVLLSVEDSDAEYHLIKMAVEETAIPVRLCRVSDGDEALWFLRRIHGYEAAPRPDLILLNLNLPKKDGFQVLTEIRTSGSLRSIPIIMFTTSARATERKKAIALGAQDFISKPGTLAELLEAVTAVCERFLAEG
jgi:two-component system, chemotaxis family, response regulator Rcp1